MTSKELFELRKEAKNLSGDAKLNKLLQALDSAQLLINEQDISNNDGSPDSCSSDISKIHSKFHSDNKEANWIKRALAWILVDIVKYWSLIDLHKAKKYYSTLCAIEFNDSDEVIEKEKSNLLVRFDENYKFLNNAEQLSRNEKYKEAIEIFHKIKSNDNLSEILHEKFGWIIYKYIKDYEKHKLTSTEVKKLFLDYLDLKNEKPSKLHSRILQLALKFSKDTSQINLFSFFKLWNPNYLSEDDKISHEKNNDFSFDSTSYDDTRRSRYLVKKHNRGGRLC